MKVRENVNCIFNILYLLNVTKVTIEKWNFFKLVPNMISFTTKYKKMSTNVDKQVLLKSLKYFGHALKVNFTIFSST